MKRFYQLAFIFLFSSFLGITCISMLVRKPGFTLSKIRSSTPYDPQWDIPISLEELSEVQAILSQKFTYLASGNHCYTFVSDDGDYVIKFFKQKQITPKSWKKYLPIAGCGIIQENRKKYREKSYSSYVIAATKLKSETGTMYLHLTKSPHFSHNLLLIDQHGKSHSINLNKAEFLLQKRAEIGFSYLDRILAEAKIEEAALAIDSLFALVAIRCSLGILDDDCQLWKNFGFREGKAIEVDIGEFRYGSPEEVVLEQEMVTISDQMGHWINEHYPAYSFLITEALHNTTASYRLPFKKL